MTAVAGTLILERRKSSAAKLRLAAQLKLLTREGETSQCPATKLRSRFR